MRHINFAHNLRHEWRNCVSHLTRLGFVAPNEPISPWKRLQTSGLADADGAILNWVTETTVGIAYASRGETGCRPVPGQTAVDVGMALELLVAIEGHTDVYGRLAWD